MYKFMLDLVHYWSRYNIFSCISYLRPTLYFCVIEREQLNQKYKLPNLTTSLVRLAIQFSVYWMRLLMFIYLYLILYICIYRVFHNDGAHCNSCIMNPPFFIDIFILFHLIKTFWMIAFCIGSHHKNKNSKFLCYNGFYLFWLYYSLP